MSERTLLLWRLRRALRVVIGQRLGVLSNKQRTKARRAIRLHFGVAREAGRRKRNRLRAVLLEHRERPCANCGRYYPGRMEFDHLPSREPKLKSPCEIRNIGQLLVEMAKCEIVCCGCHGFREEGRGRTHAEGESLRLCPNAYHPGGFHEPDPHVPEELGGEG